MVIHHEEAQDVNTFTTTFVDHSLNLLLENFIMLSISTKLAKGVENQESQHITSTLRIEKCHPQMNKNATI